MKREKHHLGLIGLPIFFILIAVVVDDGHYFLIYFLGVIALGLIFWGLSYLFRSKRQREILRHLTQEEREAINAMSGDYGKLIARTTMPVVVLVVAILFFFTGGEVTPTMLLYAFVVGPLCGLLMIPFGARQRKEMRDFLANSEYARRTSPS